MALAKSISILPFVGADRSASRLRVRSFGTTLDAEAPIPAQGSQTQSGRFCAPCKSALRQGAYLESMIFAIVPTPRSCRLFSKGLACALSGAEFLG